MRKWVSVSKDGQEWLHIVEPNVQSNGKWTNKCFPNAVELSLGTIENLTGYKMSYDFRPVMVLDKE